jgi:putative drug exporter of the RND superfamily
MISLAKFSIRRPKTALVGWVVVAVLLSVLGISVDHYVSPQVNASKTQSYNAQQLTDARFGPTQNLPILLKGPKAQLDKQGPKLVAALVKRGNTRVLSAWDAGTAGAGLRPKPTAALVIASVPRTEKNVIKEDLPQIKQIVAQQVSPPVKSYLSGAAVLDQAVKDQSVQILQNAAVIAIGVLFVLLLIGLRAPLGAGLVTVVAGTVTMSTFGLIYLLGKGGMDVDATVLASTAIAGLARGASYPLVMLDRYHHQRQKRPEAPAEELLSEAVGTTGRALLYAGTVMIAALLVVEVLGVTNVVATLGIGALLATALATGAAVVVVPAGLALFGDAAVSWRLPAPAFLSGIWDRMVAVGGSIVRHPLATGSLATAGLLALAVPGLAADTGPQTPELLPASNQARVAYDEINRVMGPGYLTQYGIVVYNPKGPITTAAGLAQISSFEAKVAKDPAVASVTGPGANFYSSSTQLRKLGPGLANSVKVTKKSKADLLKLINGLGQAGAGSTQLQSGLASAASGANQLHGGSGKAQTGAGQLHSGLAQAKSGSAQLQAGLNQALAGANALTAGGTKALAGASQLSAGLGAGAPQVKEGLPAVGQLASASASTAQQITKAQGATKATQSELTNALNALNAMGAGKSDPQYGSALAAVQSANSSAATASTTLQSASQSGNASALIAAGVNVQINKLSPQLTQAASGSAQLAAGIKQLRDGNAELASGLSQLSGGGGQLNSGLGQLTAGAGQLEAGLALLTNGTGQLAYGLSGGVGPAGQLVTGLGTMQKAVAKSRGQIPSTADLEKLFKSSPGLWNSGYLVLAAIQGAPPADRNAANMVINLTRGGNAGQIMIVSRYPLDDQRVNQLGDRLRAMSASFAKSSGLQVLVGGTAGSQWDTANVTDNKLPAVIIGELVVVALLLMIMLRAILIPLVATLCAALTTAAGFGAMQLLFGGSNPPLGGSGTWYSVALVEVLAALYGATLVYVVVLITRARDYFVTTGDARASLVHGMRATIAATTGMATITIGVLIPFMFTEFMPIRMIAVAAALGVGIVAYVVIPVLLPAAMSLLGRAGWWPTHGPRPVEADVAGAPPEAAPPVKAGRRLSRPHLPHRRPGAAH